jgi:hypothetical protein
VSSHGTSVPPELDGEQSARLAVEIEVRDLRQRLAVREHSLAELNRRIVQLERGGTGIAEFTSLAARNQELESQVRELVAEQERFRQTKLFRWTRSARLLYGRARRLRGL